MFRGSIERTMLWIAVMMVFTTGVLGWMPDFGSCPRLKTIENFDIQRYLGKWYEAERYFFIMSLGTKCYTSNYTMDENGALSITSSHISTIMSKADVRSWVGNVEPLHRVKNDFIVHWDNKGYPYTTSHVVLSTDYDNYSVEWSCVNSGLFNFKSAWILTRQRTPPVSVLENAYQILDRNQISKAYLFRTDQKNCPEDY